MHHTRSLPFTYEHGPIASPRSSVSSPPSQMPTVFVHPPEDEAMPWCAFDGGQENANSGMAFTTPEMEEVVHSLLDGQSQLVHPSVKDAPTFNRSQADSAVIMPRRGSLNSSHLANRNPKRLSVIPESPKRPKERDDDDIVEIMKVRRGEGMPDVAYANGSVPMRRRTKTLRSRAAQALRSIKNVGKAPRTRLTMEHIIPAKENGFGTAKIMVPAPSSQVPSTTPADKQCAKAVTIPSQSTRSLPRLKKRVSQPLSNLFGLGPGGTEASPDTSDEPGFGASPSHSRDFRTLPYSSRGASASTSALDMLSDEPARPTSPTFSIRSARQKFSFVNLQSIFGNTDTPNASEQASEPQQMEENPEVDDPASLRTVQTPVDDDDEGWDSGEVDYDSPRRNVDPSGTLRRPRPLDENSYPEGQEFSFEMRINSLHFDSFSFDADAF